MLGTEAAYWIGLVAHGALFFGYLGLALYEGQKKGAHAPALWSAVAALFFTFQRAAGLLDIGWYQRLDGIDVERALWIVITISMVLAGGGVSMLYLWHEPTNGWAMMAYGGLSSLFFLFCQLDESVNRRIIFLTGGFAVGALWLFYALYYAPYRHATPAQRSKFSKNLALLYTILFAAFYVLAALVLLLSNSWVGTIHNSLRDWLYLVATAGLSAVPLIARLDYRLVPEDLKIE